jgi:hypothetical protein
VRRVENTAAARSPPRDSSFLVVVEAPTPHWQHTTQHTRACRHIFIVVIVASPRFVKLLKLIKVTRLVRILRNKAFQELEYSGAISPSLTKLVKLLGAFLLCIHFLACACVHDPPPKRATRDARDDRGDESRAPCCTRLCVIENRGYI